ncbi:hypothetical protein BU15DRAFT_65455 [Melanogaster broomeanus]|nr:hypothetical protein BU15DRAFT_65455 [Melanogaster broomeanus]
MAANNTGGEKAGGLGSKINCTWHVSPFLPNGGLSHQRITGIGESIRGAAMDTADTVTNSKTGEAKNEDIVAKGQSEISEGMARMRGGPAEPAGAGIGAEAQGQGREQPPLPPLKDRDPGYTTTRRTPPQGGKDDSTHRGEQDIQGAEEQTRQALLQGTSRGQNVGRGDQDQPQISTDSPRGRQRSGTTPRGKLESTPQDQRRQEQQSEIQDNQTRQQAGKEQTWFNTGSGQQRPGEGPNAASEAPASRTKGTRSGLIGPGADAPQGPGSAI